MKRMSRNLPYRLPADPSIRIEHVKRHLSGDQLAEVRNYAEQRDIDPTNLLHLLVDSRRESFYNELKHVLRTFQERKNELQNIVPVEHADQFIRFLLFSSSLIEELSTRVLYREFLSDECTNTTNWEFLYDLTQSSREDLLQQNYIIGNGLKGQMKEIRNMRNEFAHNVFRQTGSETVVESVDSFETVIDKIDRVVERLFTIIGIYDGTIRKEGPESYRRKLRERALQTLQDTRSYENLTQVPGIEVADIKWREKGDLGRENYDIVAGIERDFNSLTKGQYQHLMNLIREWEHKIQLHLREDAIESPVTSFEFAIYQLREAGRDTLRTAELLGTTEEYVRRKENVIAERL